MVGLAVLTALLQTPRPQPVEWRGMPAYRLANAVSEAIVVPKLGRVMEFRLLGKDNILWAPPSSVDTSGWINHGGDKVWIAPQTLWGWPPDPAFDGEPHAASIRGEWLILTSNASSKLGMRVVRRLRLKPGEAVLQSENQVINLGPGERTASPWQVAQLDDPVALFADLQRRPGQQSLVNYYDEKDPQPRLQTTQVLPSKIVVRRHPTGSRKYGVFNTTGIVALMKGDQSVWMSMKVDRRLSYPDDNSPFQIYINPDPNKYAEVEAAGPLKKLKAGESAAVMVELGIGL